MMWVIIGHVYANFLLTGAIDNWADAFKVILISTILPIDYNLLL